MRTKLFQFFKHVDKIGTDTKFSLSFDMSKLLLEYKTVLGAHVILENNQKMSKEGKKLIRSRTKTEIDYYFELLRIYYVNYKKTKRKFIENNEIFKKDCMKFIKDNGIKVRYPEVSEIGQKGKGCGNTGFGCGKGWDKSFGQNEYIPRFEEYTDDEVDDDEENQDKEEENQDKEEENKDKEEENQDKEGDNQDKEGDNQDKEGIKFEEENQDMKIEDRFAIMLYDHSNKYKERIHKPCDVWRKIYRVISLYTHPDKTNKEILHNLFRKVLRKYECGDNYFMIFIIKILGIDGLLKKQYKNFMKKHKKKYEAYIEELNNRISYFWNARTYYIKCPVYNYTKMNKENKIKLVKICLSNNMLEFKKYSKYVAF